MLSVTRFVYDGSGARVMTINPDSRSTVFPAQSAGLCVGEHYEVEGSTTRSYYYLGGQRIVPSATHGTKAMRVDEGQSSDVYWLHSDHPSASLRTGLGSTSTLPLRFARGAAQSDINGNEVVTGTVHSRSSPYGEYRVTPSAGLTDKGFTGRAQNDEVALIYMRARYYVPGIGRFASADTIVPDPLNPQSLNRYSYVFNNPLVLSDLTGHSPFTDWLTEVGQQSPVARSLIVGANEVVSHINQQTEKVFYPDANTDQGDRLLACAEIGGGSVLFAATATEVAFGTLTTAATAGGTATVATTTGGATTAACADGDCGNEAQAVATGINSVYQYVENGITKYIGITNDFARRAAEHLQSSGYDIKRIPGLDQLSRYDVRATEQVLIEYHGLENLNNQINSIAASNPIYQDSIQRGAWILEQIGYFME